VLVGFGFGALAGFLVGGRLGDVRPYTTAIAAPAVTTLPLLAICLLSRWAALVAALIVLLGLFRLGGNPGLISLAVRSAGRAPILGSALTVAAFNFGTAAGPGSTGSRWTLNSARSVPPRSARSSPR
jgi:DHA1 family inner membrane transport protein